VSISPRFAWLRNHAVVRIESRAVPHEDLDLLVLLSGYLLVLAGDAAGVVAVAGA
jgi:hypothetical protein